MELRQRPRIGVMGPAACSPRGWQLAREVGFGIGRGGGILICGGLGGVMEAAAMGAKEAGGVTIGILPRSGASEANRHIDIPIVTDLGNARNVINVLTSRVIIAIHGSYGTLSEIALALKCGTPVVGLETWALTPPEGGAVPDIAIANTPEEAVAIAFRLAQTGAR
ncbi:MAG TPA: TIGR00725 family protein [Spirochaetia bacterium]|nr:TIGR00725 family protein [Spirochaetia bacterium]